MREKRRLCIALLSGIVLSQPLAAMPAAESTLSAENAAIAQQDVKKVSLHLRNASPKQAIAELQEKTGMTFSYEEWMLKQLPPVTVKVKNEPVADVLERIFGNTDFSYTVSGNTVTLKQKTLNAKTSYRLTGTIVDPEGYPLIGATVVVKGTANGVTTDVDGKYSITVHPYENLQFSYIGMEIQNVEYKGARRLDVMLSYDEATRVDEVVVTGIFKKAKESYTGSVTSVSQEDLKISRGQNVLQTLKNLDASINFTTNNLIREFGISNII